MRKGKGEGGRERRERGERSEERKGGGRERGGSQWKRDLVVERERGERRTEREKGRSGRGGREEEVTLYLHLSGTRSGTNYGNSDENIRTTQVQHVHRHCKKSSVQIHVTVLYWR